MYSLPVLNVLNALPELAGSLLQGKEPAADSSKSLSVVGVGPLPDRRLRWCRKACEDEQDRRCCCSRSVAGDGVLPSFHVGFRQRINWLPLVADVIRPGEMGLDTGLPPNLLGNEFFLRGKSGDVLSDPSGVDKVLSGCGNFPFW